MAWDPQAGLEDYDIDDLMIVEDNTKTILEAFPTALNKAMEMIGQLAEGYAKRLTPVVTGRLRNSITHTIDNEGNAYIGTNVEYAYYVEEGWCAKHKQAHRMLHHAASDHTSTYKKVIEDCLKNA